MELGKKKEKRFGNAAAKDCGSRKSVECCNKNTLPKMKSWSSSLNGIQISKNFVQI